MSRPGETLMIYCPACKGEYRNGAPCCSWEAMQSARGEQVQLKLGQDERGRPAK